jgi:hypothetical protein
MVAALSTIANGYSVLGGSQLERNNRQLFDFGWTFTHNGKTVNVDLPHDWDIYEGSLPTAHINIVQK